MKGQQKGNERPCKETDWAVDEEGRPTDRRKENEASVLRRMVGMMLRYQEARLKEEQRSRFWQNVRWIGMAVAIVFMAVVNIAGFSKLTGAWTLPVPIDGEYASLVRLEGVIDASKRMSSKTLVPALRDAFEDEKSKGVLLEINSPGGSPVQSAIIFKEIQRLRAKYPDKKLVVVAEDLMASGGYYIAASADEIYANENSIVGSIGVKIEGYGVSDLAHRLGIERRIFTAGTHKVRMDPLQPLNEEDRAKFEHTLKKLHKNFIAAVKDGRGNRLKGDPKVLYSGDFWTAGEALALGLIDGVSTPDEVLKNVFGVEKVRDYSPAPGFIAQITGALIETLTDRVAPQASFAMRLDTVM